MADDESRKPSIPAWQRSPASSQPDSGATTSNSTKTTPKQGDEEEIDDEPLPAEGSATSVSYQLEQIESFLEDPAIKAAPTEKKRAFLKSKSIPVETIDKYLEEPSQAVSFDGFQTFQQSVPPQQPQAQTVQAPLASSPAPPIITYPEYLVEAHHPPPLITPERVLNATYVAGGIAALLYGASQYLISPMVESLTASRQDFASHTQSKIDEFNDRLSKIVSKVPASAKSHDSPEESEDVDSLAGDPTELYSRDFGTQTSPASSRRPSVDLSTSPPPSAMQKQINTLSEIKGHIEAMAESVEKNSESQKERQESLNRLQHYLDTLLFASPAINLWGANDVSAANKTPGTRDDVVEQVKKEIRGVKGLLLNARRFPSSPAARLGA